MNSSTADHVVDALIAAQLVDPGRRQAAIAVVGGVLDVPRPSMPVADEDRGLPQIVEVVAYLGGALVLAAGSLFMFQQWDDLDFAVQVGLLAAAAVILAVAGGVASRVPAGGPPLSDQVHDSRRRLSGTLLTGAALTVAFLVGLVVEDVTDTGSSEVYWPAVLGAGAGVLVAAVAYRFASTAVGVLGLMAGAITVVLNLASVVDRDEGDAIGVALFLLGVAWLVITERRWFDQVTVARTLGVTTTLIGAQVPVMVGDHSWLGYLLTVLVAVVGIAIYLAKVAWPYLAVAVVAVTLVVPEAVSDWTDGSFGAIGAVLVSGITLLLASFAGYRVRAQAVD